MMVRSLEAPSGGPAADDDQSAAGRVSENAISPWLSASSAPPCASASPLATYSPTLLPPFEPGGRGWKSASAPAASSSVPARDTRTVGAAPRSEERREGKRGDLGGGRSVRE